MIEFYVQAWRSTLLLFGGLQRLRYSDESRGSGRAIDWTNQQKINPTSRRDSLRNV